MDGPEHGTTEPSAAEASVGEPSASADQGIAGGIPGEIAGGITGGEPTAPGPTAAQPGEAERRCAWCAATAPADATRCPACGAALVESEHAAVAIPGVTSIDPNVVADEEATRRQLKRQARGPSTLGATLGFIGVPFGHVIGSAIEDLAATRAAGSRSDVNKMGIMDLLELERKPADDDGTDPADAPQLGDPWVDLPPPTIADQIAGTEFDPWATADQSAPNPYDPWAAQPAPGAATGGADEAAPVPNVLTTPDPWAFDGGPWSQDPWANRDEGPGSDPAKRR